MARDFYVNTAAPSLDSAIVAGRKSTTPVSAVDFSLGENPTVRLFFVDGSGQFASFSGDSSYMPRLSIAVAGATPDSGTFKLTFEDPDGNVDTTAALSHDISAADLQTELEKLSSIDAGEITVSGEFPIWTIDFDSGTLAKTDVNLIEGEGANLFPESTVRVLVAQEGDASNNERQIVRLMQKPLVLKDQWNTISNGFQAEVTTATRRYAEFIQGKERANALLNIQVEEPGDKTINYALQRSLLRNEFVDPAALVEPQTRPLFDELKTKFVQNRIEINSLVGTGDDKLEALDTETEKAGQRLVFHHDVKGVDMEYLLVDSPAANPVPWLVKPRGYDATTNDKGWRLKRVMRDGIIMLHVQGTDDEFVMYAAAKEGGNITAGPDQNIIKIDS